MKVFERYFSLHPVRFCLSFPFVPDMIVIIPVLDDRDIFQTIESLNRCVLIQKRVGVVVIMNHSEQAAEEVKMRNRVLADELASDIHQRNLSNESICFVLLKAFDLPAKYAGVGLARKIAMDAAVAYFYHHSLPEAPVASLDADTWVDSDYFMRLIYFFREHPVCGVSIDCCHRTDDPLCDDAMRRAIILYELYLRYYYQALAYTGHPYAYPCIGSAFAVRAVDYAAQGGMNKRQAGEDFYFLQKLIATGRFALLTSIRVYPSPRCSERTPFGTGRSVRQIMENGGVFPVYRFEAFRVLKTFFAGIPALFRSDTREVVYWVGQQPVALQDFLAGIQFPAMIEEVRANCASEKQFVKRFFDCFNAFRVLKYLNFIHDGYMSKMDVTKAVRLLLQAKGMDSEGEPERLLQRMRE